MEDKRVSGKNGRNIKHDEEKEEHPRLGWWPPAAKVLVCIRELYRVCRPLKSCPM